MTWLRDAVWLALLGAAAWGAPALPSPLAWALGGAGLFSLLLLLFAGKAERTVRGAVAVACGVVLAHAVSAGPLPTDDAWLSSPAAAAAIASVVAALFAAVVALRALRALRGQGDASAATERRRDLPLAAALTLLFLAVVPLGLVPLGF